LVSNAIRPGPLPSLQSIKSSRSTPDFICGLGAAEIRMPSTAAASAKTATKKAAIIAKEDARLSINQDQPLSDADKK
jgi:hypothetical protein